jgi:hypothetical protein
MLTDKELDAIRRKMLELEEEPPLSGWEKIQTDIHTPKPWWLKWLWVAALLLVGTGGSVLYLMLHKADSPIPQPAVSTTSIIDAAAGTAVAAEKEVSSITATGETLQLPLADGQDRQKPTAASPSKGAAGTLLQPGPEVLAKEESKQAEASSEKERPGFLATKANNQQLAAPAQTPAELQVNEQWQIGQEQAATPAVTQAAQATIVESARNQDASASGHLEPHRPEPAYQEGAAVDHASDKGAAFAEAASTDRIKSAAPAPIELDRPSLRITEERSDAAHTQSVEGDSGARPAMGGASPENEELYLPMLPRKEAVLLLADGTVRLLPLKKEAEADYLHVEEPPFIHPQRRTHIWAVGIYFAPRYAYRSFTPSATDEVMITGLNQQQHSPRDRFGYEWGAAFSTSLSSRLQLDGGLSFLKLQENISYTYTTGRVESTERVKISENEIQLTPIYAMEDRQLISTFAYGSLHAGATYYLLQNSFRRFNFSAGGAVNLLLRGQTTEYMNGEWVGTTVFPAEEDVLEQSNYSFYMGVGYNRSISKQYELSVMPMLNYYLGSTFKEREPFGLRPYSLGLKLQLQRRFNVKTVAVY